MNWKKLLQGVIGSFLTGACAAVAPLAGDGLTQPELIAGLLAGLAMVGAYLKHPDDVGFSNLKKKD